MTSQEVTNSHPKISQGNGNDSKKIHDIKIIIPQGILWGVGHLLLSHPSSAVPERACLNSHWSFTLPWLHILRRGRQLLYPLLSHLHSHEALSFINKQDIHHVPCREKNDVGVYKMINLILGKKYVLLILKCDLTPSTSLWSWVIKTLDYRGWKHLNI